MNAGVVFKIPGPFIFCYSAYNSVYHEFTQLKSFEQSIMNALKVLSHVCFLQFHNIMTGSAQLLDTCMAISYTAPAQIK